MQSLVDCNINMNWELAGFNLLTIDIVYELVRGAGFEPARLAPEDFRTTIAFATLSVCGLDYTFIIALLP